MTGALDGIGADEERRDGTYYTGGFCAGVRSPMGGNSRTVRLWVERAMKHEAWNPEYIV